MIEKERSEHHSVGFWIFLFCWLFLNLVQAHFSILDPDEAYYWMYAQRLDWGYFDHPPAIAVLIHLGYSLFATELGLRLFTVILQFGTIYFIWSLADKPRRGEPLRLFLLITAAMPMLHVFGFIATPDGPLLFCTALFFWLYRRFLNNRSWGNTLLWGMSMAILLYSKYHGILIIGFTLLSNLRLLRSPKFYIASIVGAFLFLPHIYWQFAHDFPSFRYHLQGRDDPYELKHTLNYLINQLVIFSPLLFPFILIALRKTKVEGSLLRAWYFVIIGFWVFFFFTTFKGHAEPQWTSALTIPFIVITYQYALGKGGYRIWLKRMAWTTIVLLLVVRLLLMLDVGGITKNIQKDQWIQELPDIAGSLPIVFENSYRNTSVYNFYNNSPSYTFTDILYRRSQYDIWDDEKQLHNGSVLMVGQRDWECIGCDTLQFGRKEVQVKKIDSLQVVQRVTFSFRKEQFTWEAGNQYIFKVNIHNPYPHTIDMDTGNMPISLVAILISGFEFEDPIPVEIDLPEGIIPPGDLKGVEVALEVPFNLKETYQMAIGTRTGDLPPAYNSDPVPLVVK